MTSVENILVTLFCGMAFFAPSEAFPIVCHGQSPSVSDVVRGMKQYDSKFSSISGWLIDFSHERSVVNPPPWYVSNFQPRQIVFAVADESVMATVTYKVGKEVHSWNKRKTNIVMDVVTKDNTDRLRVSGTRQIISEKFDTYLQNVFYFQEGLNIHTFEEALAQRGSRAPGEHYLPPAALPYDQMVLRPRQVTVDDVACSVIELPGHEIQWIDPGCGYIARRIIRYQKSGTLSVEIENKEIFCDRLSGIWLPKRQIIRRYNTDSDPVELRGKLRAIETNTLITFRRERLPESYFELTRITDGVLIDTTRNITETIQHGRVVESKIGKR